MHSKLWTNGLLYTVAHRSILCHVYRKCAKHLVKTYLWTSIMKFDIVRHMEAVANAVARMKDREMKYFYSGDKVQDLTFDPPLSGVVVKPHEKPNAYYVRIEGAINDVII